MSTLTLTLCESNDCFVPITETTKHKAYPTFCKPCGRAQRSANSSGDGKVRQRWSSTGYRWILNDKNVWVREDVPDFAIRKEGSKFSLYVQGIKVFNQSPLRYLMDQMDKYDDSDTKKPLTDLNYHFRGHRPISNLEQVAFNYIGPWIEYEYLGTRDDKPFDKRIMKTDIGQLVGSRNSGYTLEFCIHHQVEQYGWLPSIG